jgi:hypothetical protein
MILVSILHGSAFFVSAQQTIFGLPTADVSGSGQAWIEINAVHNINDPIAGWRFS